ncbi:MAG: TetR/AcrR family transcriptional regulator [Oligoflexia bacterium]|nr:TetR/AcrR family transcriptional regulator [Oligoflexia bacterium]
MVYREINKDETFWSVLNSAIELDFLRGHQRWTLSELSRNSKVTRSLIYYYFGKSKEEMLLEAVKLIGEEFFGLKNTRLAMWGEGKVAESVLLSRKLLEKSPCMGSFYMVHRTANSPIGEALRKLEEDYKAKISKFLSGKSSVEYEAIFALFLGLVLTPRLSDDSVRKAVDTVLKISSV